MLTRFYSIMLLTFSNIVFANFVVSPTQVETSVKTKVVSYTIENRTDVRAAYDIQVFERQLLPSGEEVLLDTKDLRAFPSKVIVEAGKKKRIKVMYLGKRDISSEKPYRVNFIQDDKDVSQEQSNNLNVRFEFFTSLYIQPKNISSKLETEVVKKNGQWLLYLQNTGTKHHILNDWKLALGGSDSNTVSMPAVNVLANTHVYLPINKKLESGALNSISIIDK
ncbi:fimbria/pilus periplasmic chaperone [Vibrio mytili]|uniref:Pili assembly chaperone N-terminal domain-containing protein n=1 Tax=Vibrio mytili TaxID=50718 RepID=A0A0C3HU98_9VIBR|nr:fimbria/pilus periplasmic chaperone [Vibrio mytili]KIN11791.1 hypothetical protein SU60_04480 [Vibrio mytili]